MSENRSNQNEHEVEMAAKSAFRNAVQGIEPSPFFKSRIVNRFILKQRRRKFVQIFVPIAFAALAVFMFGRFHFQNRSKLTAVEAGLVNKDYVVAFMFTARQLSTVGSVEMQLPDGVRFDSANRSVNRSRVLRLALHPARKKMRLPFVIRALKTGHAILKLKMFDRTGKDLGNREMSVNFVSKV